MNCNSTHFKAIAAINIFTYNILCKDDDQHGDCKIYLQNWLVYENLALRAEDAELNTRYIKSWKSMKHDSKKMWGLIDWKGKSGINKDYYVNESVINSYFINIFQSDKTKNQPVVTDIVEIINIYEIHVPALDRMPDINELDIALKSICRGISFDGLPPEILHIFPLALKEVLLLLMQRVFFGKYPKDWNKQMLHAVTKHGHTYNHPQLRGIAIAPLLCRLNDTIMDNRFRCWYVPNPEQSGFRPKQGCLLPLFSLVIDGIYLWAFKILKKPLIM